MGTPHLICIYQDGEYRVAQYGQWDGYPQGQGIQILNFLKAIKDDIRPFTDKVRSYCHFGTPEQIKAQWIACGADLERDTVSMDVSYEHKRRYPENNRDTSADILNLIYHTHNLLYLVNDLAFAANSLFCEWCYVIDFDSNTFEVYTGFNREPVPAGERFAELEPYQSNSGVYYPVYQLAKFPLSQLPTETEFYAACKVDDEIEENK